MPKRPANAREKRHLARVKTKGCVCCEEKPGPSHAHHLRIGQGTAQRAGHFCTAALCEDCHAAPHGIHGDRSRMRLYGVNEMDLLDRTLDKVYGGLK